jgi:hypothetical protein
MSLPLFADSLTLACAARRAALLAALREQRNLTLAQLDVLLRKADYGEELGQLTVFDLTAPDLSSLSPTDAIMWVFRARPGTWLASSFFVHSLGIKRWTAQALLGELVERGELIRVGSTSATRYRLAGNHERGDSREVSGP